MRKSRMARVALAGCLSLSLCFLGASGNAAYDASDFAGWGKDANPWAQDEKPQVTETTEVLTQNPQEETKENKGISSDTLYFEALTEDHSVQQKYSVVKRGNYVAEASLNADVVFLETHEVIVSFPYGDIYLERTFIDDQLPYRHQGDLLAQIRVELDEIEMARLEQTVARMEERGETSGYYDYLKQQLDAMHEAATQTDIVMEEDGFLVEQDVAFRGAKISQYRYVVADSDARLIEVANVNNQFRFGQKVTVTAFVSNTQKTGTGTVISGSSRLVSEAMLGGKAYIRLDEDAEELYDGRSLKVSTRTIEADNILLMDEAAAFLQNGFQMVKVKDAFGIHSEPFWFGRKGASQYWVVEGLKEGDEVLLR